MVRERLKKSKDVSGMAGLVVLMLLISKEVEDTE
jgi:hypothetical protein